MPGFDAQSFSPVQFIMVVPLARSSCSVHSSSAALTVLALECIKMTNARYTKIRLAEKIRLPIC